MRTPVTRGASWASTLDRMKQQETPATTEAEAMDALSKLFRRTDSANAVEKAGTAKPRRCTKSVADGPKGRCGLALLTADRDFCTFHANPVAFAASGVDEAEIYNGSPVMKEFLAP